MELCNLAIENDYHKLETTDSVDDRILYWAYILDEVIDDIDDAKIPIDKRRYIGDEYCCEKVTEYFKSISIYHDIINRFVQDLIYVINHPDNKTPEFLGYISELYFKNKAEFIIPTEVTNDWIEAIIYDVNELLTNSDSAHTNFSGIPDMKINLKVKFRATEQEVMKLYQNMKSFNQYKYTFNGILKTLESTDYFEIIKKVDIWVPAYLEKYDNASRKNKVKHVKSLYDRLVDKSGLTNIEKDRFNKFYLKETCGKDESDKSSITDITDIQEVEEEPIINQNMTINENFSSKLFMVIAKVTKMIMEIKNDDIKEELMAKFNKEIIM